MSLLEPEKPVLVPWQISERFGSKLSSGTFAFVSDTNIMIDALEQHTDEDSLHSIMDWIDCGYIIHPTTHVIRIVLKNLTIITE